MKIDPQIIVFAVSLVAILMLSGFAWVIRLGGSPGLRTDDEARRAAYEVEDGFEADDVILDRSGASALITGRDGRFMAIKRHGNRFAGRVLGQQASATADASTLTIHTGERRFGDVHLSHPEAASWAAAINRLNSASDA